MAKEVRRELIQTIVKEFRTGKYGENSLRQIALFYHQGFPELKIQWTSFYQDLRAANAIHEELN